MPLSIKVNLRVTGHCNQGGRKYMEDMFSVAYQQTTDDKDLEYAFFGIFDGHGGGEAATFAKEHLMEIIVKQRNFWSDKDEDVLRAIRDGYVNTHYAMWRELDKWPTTASGLPSTAGTTASVAFIRKGKIYIGHVGDSGIILGYQEDGDPQWKAKALTKDHKPESYGEMMRIHESGGKVVNKSGVPRVVWNRPRIGHKGPVRRSTHIDEIPFLAVARSLGDLWSYNSELNTFVVSPEPDVKVVTVDVKSQRCLIFGTDGLWNMLTPQAAVSIVQSAERHNEKHLIASQQTGNGQADVQMWINPSKSLVDTALERWFSTRLRADNTSVVTLMLDPPGPSRSEVLMSRKNDQVMSPRAVPRPIPRPETPEMIEPENPRMCPETSREITEEIESSTISDAKIAAAAEYGPENPEKTETPSGPCVPEEPTKMCVETSPKRPSKEKPEMPKIASPERIQVPEISSSDASDDPILDPEPPDILDDPYEPPEPEKPEPEVAETRFLRESPKIPEKRIFPEKSTKIALLTEKKPASKAISTVLRRQNPFFPSCSDLTAGGTVPRAGQTQISTRRQTHNTSLCAHLSTRITRRKRQKGAAAPFHTESHDKSWHFRANRRLKRENLSLIRDPRISPRDTGATENPPEIIGKTRENTEIMETAATPGGKRRHSSTANPEERGKCQTFEREEKRRTRSEDRPAERAAGTDENVPENRVPKITDENHRLSWPESQITDEDMEKTKISSQEKMSGSGTSSGSSSSGGTSANNSSYQRRSLEKKATPVKTIRRPSTNGGTSARSHRTNFALREWSLEQNSPVSWVKGAGAHCAAARTRLNRTVPGAGHISTENSTTSLPSLQRWLRSDTLAATPVKTLRSRNVDIDGHTVPAQLAHQYGIVKTNRAAAACAAASALAGKLKIAGKTGKLTARQGTGSVPGATGTCAGQTASGTSTIGKRVKSPYNPTARRSALGNKSRLKRLGK